MSDAVEESWTVESIIVSERGQMALGRIAYWAAWVEAKLAWVALELMIELGPPRKAIVQGRTAGQVIELCRALLDAASRSLKVFVTPWPSQSPLLIDGTRFSIALSAVH